MYCMDYGCISHGISKLEKIHLLEGFVLDDRGYIQNEYQRDQ